MKKTEDTENAQFFEMPPETPEARAAREVREAKTKATTEAREAARVEEVRQRAERAEAERRPITEAVQAAVNAEGMRAYQRAAVEVVKHLNKLNASERRALIAKAEAMANMTGVGGTVQELSAMNVLAENARRWKEGMEEGRDNAQVIHQGKMETAKLEPPQTVVGTIKKWFGIR